MTTAYTRRDCLKLMATGAVASTLASCTTPAAGSRLAGESEEDLRGIYVILATPWTEGGEVAWEELASQVDWLAEAGAHGLVWPQNASDYRILTMEHIKRGFAMIAEANRGRRMALVLGVQQDDTPEAVELAHFAEAFEPDMMIAMPPKAGRGIEKYREYYSALAEVTERPMMMQTIPNLPDVDFPTDFILEMASHYPHLGYVKEEHEPVFDRIQALVGQPQIQRVFAAQRGRAFPYELRLGVDGTLNGMAMYADVFVRVWNEYRAGNWDAVRDIHGKILIGLNTEQAIPGAGRYMLQRRGIFKTTVQGNRRHTFSRTQVEQIEHSLRGLEPYMVRPLVG